MYPNNSIPSPSVTVCDVYRGFFYLAGIEDGLQNMAIGVVRSACSLDLSSRPTQPRWRYLFRPIIECISKRLVEARQYITTRHEYLRGESQ